MPIDFDAEKASEAYYKKHHDDLVNAQKEYWANENLWLARFNDLRLKYEEEINETRKEKATESADKISKIEYEAKKRLADLGVAETEEELEAKKKSIDAAVEYEKTLRTKANGGKELSEDEKKAIDAKAAAEKKKLEESFKNKDKLEEKFLKDEFKKREKLEKEARKKRGAEEEKENAENLFGKGKSLGERVGALKSMFHDKDEDGNELGFSGKKGLMELANAVSDMAKQMEEDIDQIALNKSAIDTRLQGSTSNKKNFLGSYWDRISNDIVGVAGVSPLVKQSDIVTKVNELVGRGISFNVEQRAFLASISDKIATTFNVADSTMLKLIRLQQQDSTAARLGMESSMNAFLNNMYETTEYLEGIATQVRNNLEEAESLMGTTDAVEFEFQVQKWLGSLYSVGMSEKAVQSLAGALGKVAAGDISDLTGEGASNLVIMAANNAGLNVADILQNGLTASDTNNLMQAMVEYLALIYDESKSSKVVQQQFAKVYGISASDLKAAMNLAVDQGETIKNISNNNLTYSGAMGRLSSMTNSMYLRMSIGELANNVFDNFQYTLAAGIANSPVLYGVYKAANLLDSVTGGQNIPSITYAGTGFDLETTIADLMRVGALGGSILKGIGQMALAGSVGGWSGSGMLSAMGIDTGKISTISRGSGTGLTTSGVTVSQSGYAGNSEGGDVYQKTLTDSTDSAKGQLAEVKEEEGNEVTNKKIDEDILTIANLLTAVTDGTKSFKIEFKEAAWGGTVASSIL